MKSVGIIGQGRFGCLLKEILSPHFNVACYDSADAQDDLATVLKQDSIFIAVPIRAFEAVIKNIADKIRADATVIDVCSVKVHPVQVMQTLLPTSVDIIASHPLFGPDSYHLKHAKKIMLACVRNQHQRYQLWKDFFNAEQIIVEEMTPEAHDQYMARSQGITHLIGRALNEIEAEPTPINTAGFEQLLKIMQHTCNDTWELFYDLQRYNPYSRMVNSALLVSIQQLLQRIDHPGD